MDYIYTDKQLKDATQVAYLRFLEDTIQNSIADGENGPYTIENLLVKNIRKNKILQTIKLDYKSLIEYSDISENDKNILRKLPEEVFKWKIVDIHDENYKNGFYGCVIETSPENAIVDFRGSEGLKDYPGAINDWLYGDFGLFKKQKTSQHEACERYADNLLSNNILEKYKNISVTGHSLGGHLASHFTTVCAYEGNRKNIFDKIKQVVNFDGPGVSKEYIKYYKKELEKAANKIKHFQWSLVGCALNNIPGETIKTLKIDEQLYKDKPVAGKFLRHSTESIMFDKGGNAVLGNKDLLSRFTHAITVAAEYFPAELLVDAIVPEKIQKIIGLVASTIKKSIYQKKTGEIGFDPLDIKDDELKYKNTLLCGMIYNAAIQNKQKTNKQIEVLEKPYNVVSFEDIVALSNIKGEKEGYLDVKEVAINDEKIREGYVREVVDDLSEYEKINGRSYQKGHDRVG